MTAMPFNETLQSVPDSTFNETRIEESFFNPEINFEYIFHCFSRVKTKARSFVHASWNLSSIMAVRSLLSLRENWYRWLLTKVYQNEQWVSTGVNLLPGYNSS